MAILQLFPFKNFCHCLIKSWILCRPTIGVPHLGPKRHRFTLPGFYRHLVAPDIPYLFVVTVQQFHLDMKIDIRFAAVADCVLDSYLGAIVPDFARHESAPMIHMQRIDFRKPYVPINARPRIPTRIGLSAVVDPYGNHIFPVIKMKIRR